MNRIDYLLQRYLDRKETEPERIELMELIVSGNYREAIENTFAGQLTRRMAQPGASTDPSIQQDLQDVRGRFEFLKKQERRQVRVPWLRVAAAILLLAICFASWQYVRPRPGKRTERPVAQTSSVTSSGGITKAILGDGTLVWLKGRSTITYSSEFTGNTRNVTLYGEALFEVAKDPDHPFIIQCGGLTTTVLGTSFNIRSSEDKVEVVVLTGKVTLRSEGNEDLVVLPNEKAVYHGAEKQLSKLGNQAKVGEKRTVVEGTEYGMTFEDTRMAEVISKVEKKFNVKVSCAEPSIANCKVTADFTDQSLESTLLLIAEALSLEYTIDGLNVSLTGMGCP